MSHQALFEKMIGNWSGDCRTWFEPGKLADEAVVTAKITQVFGGRFLRHNYAGSMQGKPRIGEELIAYNTVTKLFQTSWIDDFHMSYAILFSQGTSIDNGFSVRGEYDVGENDPQWGWRTEYRLLDNDQLTIVAYNIQPDEPEAKAVETIYNRVAI